jgi:hypothetical protein
VRLYRSTLTTIAILLAAATLSAQNPPPPQPVPEQPASAPAPAPPRAPRPPATPLEVQIVLSRYQGDKRVSSVPYVLAVNTNGSAQLNMGAEVAIPNSTFTPGDPSKVQPIVSYNYRNVGTSITCSVITTSENGSFEVNISVDDNSVYLKDENAAGGGMSGMPAFRSFKSRNTLLLRDGQTRQYTAATDRVSGETIRIDVSLKVVK